MPNRVDPRWLPLAAVALLAACGGRPAPQGPATATAAPSAAPAATATAAPAPSALPSTATQAPTPEAQALVRYDEIRRTLAGDSTNGVAESAKTLAEETATLAPELSKAAAALAAAPDLAKAREAFGPLSDAALALRKKAKAEAFGIFYCPMVNRSWLQGDRTKVANPFYGSQMLECGWEVDENGKELKKG